MSEASFPQPGAPRRIFGDQRVQDSFDRLGYVVADLLDSGERAELLGLFDRTVRGERNTYPNFRSLRYYISIFDQDVDKRKLVDRAAKQIFGDKIERLMLDYRILLCNFMAKEPGGVGEIQVHQDFSFVDEDSYTGFNLWVPLEDTDVGNGCFYMLPGSHRLLRSSRSASAPDTLTKYNEMLKRYMVPKPIKAGSGILFDHRLFHYSPDNASDRWRPAVQLVLIPKEAEPVMLHYDRERDPEHLLVRRIEEDYLTEENIWNPARELQVVGRKPYIPLPGEAELLGMVERLKRETPVRCEPEEGDPS
jgi:hypothetical protein